MNDDQTPRYAPEFVLVMGRKEKVLSYHSFPIGQHPAGCTIVDNMVALECRTAIGSRWYGCDAAWINSELRMVIRGTNSRDTVRMRWEECKET